MKKIALIAAALLLAGCSSISAGTITAKTIEPPYTWIQYICSSYDKNGICVVQVPIFHNEPEKYRFDLTEGKDEGWVYVSYPTFDDYEVGDYYGTAK